MGPAPTVPDDELEATARHDTIEAMLDNLRLLVAHEEQRVTNLTGQGTGLGGFAGVAAAVLVAAGQGSELPAWSKAFVAVAVVLLLVSIGGVVLGLLTTRSAPIQSTRQVALYVEPGYRSVSPGRVQVQMIDTLVRRLRGLRAANRSRTVWVNRSALALMGAIVSVGAAAVIRLAS